MENPLILYVGEQEAGQALAELVESEGGFVYLPDSLMQALGMYITYFPHVVVIDMGTSYAQEVYDHLRSVDAKPVILLTHERIHLASVRVLPRDASAEELLGAIDRLDERPSVLNGVLRYA